jgi:uncharacterized repeat protein (TIGR01451 family)
MVKLVLAGLALAMPVAVLAQAAPKAPAAPAAAPITLVIEAYVARETVDAKGVKTKGLFPTDRALPGENIVYILKYANIGTVPVSGVDFNNDVPNGVNFTGVAEAWATVSIDRTKVKTFAPLAALKVKKPDGGFRAALPSDVTAVRWKFPQPVPPGAKGRVIYYAMVK